MESKNKEITKGIETFVNDKTERKPSLIA